MEHGSRTLVVSLLVVAISGCSLALSGPDGERPAHLAPKCDTGKGLVAADGVIGGLLAIGALSALSEDAPEAAAVTALASVAFIAAAARGNTLVNRCREAFVAYEGQPERSAPAGGVARQPRMFEDPYAPPADLPARRIVAPPPPAATPAATVPAAPAASAPAVPAPAAVPSAPAPAPVADDWSDFWTEVP